MTNSHQCQSQKTNLLLFKCTRDTLRFDVMNVQAQPNGYDCGVYAIANATELAYGCDPVVCVWKSEDMRSHLLDSLQSGKVTRFPRVREQRIMLGTRVRKTVTGKVLCICRMINDKTRPMIECEHCLQWYHKNCMGLEVSSKNLANSHLAVLLEMKFQVIYECTTSSKSTCTNTT